MNPFKNVKQLPKMSDDEISKFWNRVNIQSDNECWNWKGSTVSFGYGRLQISDKAFLAHRIAWYLHNHQLPGNFEILHSCDNPLCCNPNHLRIGTQADNNHDCDNRGRRNLDNRGSNHGMSKLTDENIIEIRKLRSLGFSQKSIAKKFKVNQCNISRILGRKRWKHL